MIEIREIGIGGGYFEIVEYWPQDKGIRIHLKLTDPDGDVDERTHEWMPSSALTISEAVSAFAAEVDDLPHWRTWHGNGRISIGPASDDYEGQVSAELI